MGTTTTFIFLNQHYASPSTSLLQSHYRTLFVLTLHAVFLYFSKKVNFQIENWTKPYLDQEKKYHSTVKDITSKSIIF